MLTLQNERLRLNILPERGGKIDDLIDLQSGRNWLWHPQNYKPVTGPLSAGASFDDHFAGGWEEMFPNDASGKFDGYDLPDHGEVWSQSWELRESNEFGAQMFYQCRCIPASLKKTIVLEKDKPGFQITYTIQNQSNRNLNFMLKLHPALAIEAGDEIVMPPCDVTPVDLGFSSFAGRDETTQFPHVLDKNGHQVAINKMPHPGARTREFTYLSKLAEGWCALKKEKDGKFLTFRFDRHLFPFVWLFQSHGGWRDHSVLMMEPCTNMPYDLQAAKQRGSCALLAPYGRREIKLSVELRPATF